MDDTHRRDGSRVTGADAGVRRQVTRRLVIAAVVIVTVAVAALAATVLMRNDRQLSETGPSGSTPAGGSGTTTGSANVTSTTSATAKAGASNAASSSTTASGVAAALATPRGRRAPLAAYRSNGWLSIVSELGGPPRAVTPSASGVFSLSPDGHTVALVDPSDGRLLLIDVPTGGVTPCGSAEQFQPRWSADSAWIAFVGRPSGQPGPMAVRVRRDGEGAAVLDGPVGALAVTLDGRVLTVPAEPGDSGEIGVVDASGARAALTLPVPVWSVAGSAGRVYYAVEDVRPSMHGVWSVDYDGSGAARLVGAAPGQLESGYGVLFLSPDGTRILYSVVGDDGYSRMFVTPTAGSAPRELSERRDDYPVGWTADGRGVVFIEGNALQGETQQLMTSRADGSHRRLLADAVSQQP
jgi:hypothetical protein